MARSINSVIRREDLIILSVPHRTGKIGFRFGFTTSFVGSFTTFQVVPNYGFKSRNVPYRNEGNFKGYAQFAFRPSDYTAAHATLVDGIPLFFRIEAQNPDGSFDSPEAMHLVLPHTSYGPNDSFMLSGTVPSLANLAASLEVQLPMRVKDFEIKVDADANLAVAFDPGGPEYTVLPEATTGRGFSRLNTNITQLFLRGAGGTSTISSVFTLNNDPLT